MTRLGSDDLQQTVDKANKSKAELAVLFGEATVALANQLDIAELNLQDEIVRDIGAGVAELKKLKTDPRAQMEFVRQLRQGSRLLLCMWIMDMDLLDKIQTRTYAGTWP